MNPLVYPRTGLLTGLLMALCGMAELRLEASDAGNDLRKTLGAFLDQTLTNAANKKSQTQPVVRAAAPSTVVPLKLFWSWGKQDNYTTTAAGAEEAKRNGYDEVRVEGYVFASVQPGTIPLQQYWNPERTDYQAAASADGLRDAGTWGYRFVRTEGFLLTSEQTPLPLAGGQPGAVGMTDHPIPGPSRAPDRKSDSPAGLAPAGPVGLRGEYFDNRDLRGPPKFTRFDPSINFDWGDGSPGEGLPADNFSVRWTGQIQPRYSEAYVFSGYRDDGVRVWIDDRLIIDQWKEGNWAPFASAPVLLTANQSYQNLTQIRALEVMQRDTEVFLRMQAQYLANQKPLLEQVKRLEKSSTISRRLPR